MIVSAAFSPIMKIAATGKKPGTRGNARHLGIQQALQARRRLRGRHREDAGRHSQGEERCGAPAAR